LNRTFKTPPGPFAPTDTATWPVGQVRLVIAAPGLTLSVKRLGEGDFEVQHRASVQPGALQGMPSKVRVRRGVDQTEADATTPASP
jgi:hypothetical protein